MAVAVADRDDDVAGALEGDADRFGPVLDQADAADRRGGEDGLAGAVLRLGLVVERDVARDDREVERAAGLGHAFDAADELAHDLGPLGVAEIHAVGGGERAGADRAEVAPGLGDRLLAALDRVGLAVARGAVGGDGERLLRAVDADQGRVAAGRLDVSAPTFWSYCSQIQRREARSGEAISLRRSAAMSVLSGTSASGAGGSVLAQGRS